MAAIESPANPLIRHIARSLDEKTHYLIEGEKTILHTVAATCWHPHFKGHVQQQNSIYNNWRFENVWLDK